MIEVLKETLQDSIWVNSNKYTYQYDDFGNATLGQYFNWEDEIWTQSENGNMGIRFNNGNNTFPVEGINANVYYSESIGVEEFTVNSIANFNCYPVPANQQAFVNLEISVEIYANLSLCEISGKMIKLISNGKIEKGKHQYKLETSDLKPGIYLIKLRGDKQYSSAKLIISR